MRLAKIAVQISARPFFAEWRF